MQEFIETLKIGVIDNYWVVGVAIFLTLLIIFLRKTIWEKIISAIFGLFAFLVTIGIIPIKVPPRPEDAYVTRKDLIDKQRKLRKQQEEIDIIIEYLEEWKLDSGNSEKKLQEMLEWLDEQPHEAQVFFKRLRDFDKKIDVINKLLDTFNSRKRNWFEPRPTYEKVGETPYGVKPSGDR